MWTLSFKKNYTCKYIQLQGLFFCSHSCPQSQGKLKTREWFLFYFFSQQCLNIADHLMTELFHYTPALVGAGGGGVNTLCFLTACYSRRLLASSTQSAVISLAMGLSP